MGTVNGVLDLFCAAFVVALLMGLLPQQRTRRSKEALVFRGLLFAAFVMLLTGGIAWLCFAQRPAPFRLFSTIAVLAFNAVLALYSRYVIRILKLKDALSIRMNQLHALLCTVAALLWVINGFRPFLYDFLSSRFLNPFAAAIIIVITGAVLVGSCVLIILNREKLERNQFVFLLLLSALPLLAFFPNIWIRDLHLLYAMIFFVLLCNYVRLCNMQLSDFAAQQKKLHDLQIRSTTERMKPHYIYNVLTSIYYLCDSNPTIAQKAIGSFSDYLRSVLDNLDAGGLITFEQELKTIQSYLSLEHMRFGDRFRVEFHIETDQFLLPPFSVQPLVENAVKHGVGKTDLVGEIHIESTETPTDYLVKVRDNCGGFNVEQFQQRKSNFGLRYIQQILDITVGGKISIESEVGAGTTVTIVIPKNNEVFLQKN